MSVVLECRKLSKHYGDGELAEPVLTEASMLVGRGEACVLIGPSGSGKTTLLSILGCLLTPTDGELHITGERVDFTSPRDLGELRRTRLGFVFQQSQLLPFLTVEENLQIVGRNAGLTNEMLKARLDCLLAPLGLDTLRGKMPAHLSGGQRQRTAIARALVTEPSLLLCDEPTGNLDSTTSTDIMGLFHQLHAEGNTIVIVTHEPTIAAKCPRAIRIADGKIVADGPGREVAYAALGAA